MKNNTIADSVNFTPNEEFIRVEIQFEDDKGKKHTFYYFGRDIWDFETDFTMKDAERVGLVYRSDWREGRKFEPKFLTVAVKRKLEKMVKDLFRKEYGPYLFW